MSVQWGDVATWVSAAAAVGAMAYTIVQARGAKHAGDLAREQATTAQTAAVAAERSAAAAEEQAQAQREQAEIMRQQLDAQREEQTRPQISIDVGEPISRSVVPLIFTHNGGGDLTRLAVVVEGRAVRGYATEAASDIVGVPAGVEFDGMSFRDHRTVWVDITGPRSAPTQVKVLLTCVTSDPPRDWFPPTKTVIIPPLT